MRKCCKQPGGRPRVAGGGGRPANVNRALPVNFCGGPGEIVAQLRQAPGQIGCGGVDLSFQTPGSEHPDELMEALELFGQESAAAHPRHLKIGAAICHDSDTSFSSTVPLAEQSAEAYPPLWGVTSSPLDRGNTPYIQISDDVRSPAGAGA
jgi:hypothetical protein